MKRTFNLFVLVTLLALAFGAQGIAPAQASGTEHPPAPLGLPAYYPYGPQANVDESLLDGWELCWSSLYNSTESLASILTACDGDYLLLAGGPVGSTVFDVLAAGPRADVIFDTGESNTPHNANGAGWYYNSSYSWGFALEGDPIERNSCDIQGVNGHLRLCWHTYGGNISGGWRSGNNTSLNNSTSFERFIYHPAPTPNYRKTSPGS